MSCIFEGKIPLASKGNYNEIITGRKEKETNWSVKLDSKEGKTVNCSAAMLHFILFSKKLMYM